MSDQPLRPERSLGDLLSDMSQDLSTLFRQEVELAREELKAEGRKVGRAGSAFGGAAVAALYAGFALVLTLGFALATFLPESVAFLIVTLVLAAIAAVLGLRGRKEVQAIEPAPEQTIETLKEDAQWLSERRS